MALLTEEIDLLLEELRCLILSKTVGKIYHIEPYEIYFTFRSHRQRVFLFLTARPQVSRFHLLWEGGPFPRRPSGFCERLRSLFSGTRLASAERMGPNRAVRFDFEGTDCAVVGEFFSARGNVVIVKENRYVESLFPVVRRGKLLRSGEKYRLPSERKRALSRQHPRYLLRDAAGPFGFSRAFGDLMAQRERELVFTERRVRVEAQLRRERKRAERLLARLSEELASARQAEMYRRWGEALKCHVHELRGGETELTVPDPYQPGQDMTIPLDPARKPAENLSFLFRRYRKLRAKTPHVTQRYDACVERIVELDGALAELQALSWEREEDHKRLEALRGQSVGEQPRRGAKGPKSTPAGGPRRFTVREHLLWIGRNARQNAELLRRCARGNDIFLHIAGKPGAVAILRPPSGKQVSTEALREAALLAAHFSGGKPGAAYDVDWTQVKYVQPLRGQEGRFSMAKRRTLHVSIEGDRLSAILAQATMRPQ